MTQQTGRASVWRRVAIIAVASLVAGTVLVAGVMPALAIDDEAPPRPRPGAGDPGPRLEFAYLRLQHASEDLALHLDHAGEVAGFVEEWIETLRADGQDVSQLEVALADFQAALVGAQGYQQQAADMLSQHPGFDDDGKVTDREQAVETLHEARRHVRDGRRALRDGTVDLRRAIRDWRRDHRPEPVDA
ncbi:hypothetical protein ACFLT5_00660 [Chloroflexota bacterium]